MIQTVFVGCKAGFFAGLIWGILFLTFVSPLIHQAELYETNSNQLSKVELQNHSHLQDHTSHNLSKTERHQQGHISAHFHQHETDSQGLKRAIITFIGIILLSIAFGIIYSTFIYVFQYVGFFSDKVMDRCPYWFGSISGFIGFLIFHGIPAIGLTPALPGVLNAEADYLLRQNWWLISIFCSIVGVILGLFGWNSFIKNAKISTFILFIVSAIIMALIPFLGTGIPKYSTDSITPLDLRHQFVAVSLVVSSIFWVLLGLVMVRLRNLELKG